MSSRIPKLLDTVEDHLDEDPEIRDQKYVLLSYAEPTRDNLEIREGFLMQKFIENIKSEEDPNKRVDLNAITADKFNQLYNEFKVDNAWSLTKELREQYPDKTMERAFKVRGSYKNAAQCTKRKDELLQNDKYHSIYMAQVGFWLPFNPSPNDLENYETSNKKLNEILAAKIENLEQSRIQFATERAERHNQTLALNRERQERIKNDDPETIKAEFNQQTALGL